MNTPFPCEASMDGEAKHQAEEDRQQTMGPRRSAPTQGKQLLELAEGAKLFHTPGGDGFATVPVGKDHAETLTIRGKGFRNWLSREYYQATGKAPSVKNLHDVLGVLEARARYDGDELSVYHRVGGDGHDCCLDLCDPQWRAVVINRNGWEVTSKPPVRFRRPRGALALPEPVRGGSVEELREFIN